MASPSPEIATVRAHLVQTLGPPLEVLELSGSPDKRLAKLEVATWQPAGPTGPLIMASCGISRLVMPDGRRMEALMLVRPVPSKDDTAVLVKLLGRFGLLIANATGSIPPGTVIRAPEEMAPVSTMPDLVLLPAITFPPLFRQIKKGDQTIDIAWLAPVHEIEAQLVESQGGEALMMQFSAYGVDLAAWHRPAIPKALTFEEAKAMVIARNPAPGPPDPKSRDERVAQLKANAMERAARAASQPGASTPPPAPAPPPVPPGKAPPPAFKAGKNAIITAPPKPRRPPK